MQKQVCFWQLFLRKNTFSPLEAIERDFFSKSREKCTEIIFKVVCNRAGIILSLVWVPSGDFKIWPLFQCKSHVLASRMQRKRLFSKSREKCTENIFKVVCNRAGIISSIFWVPSDDFKNLKIPRFFKKKCMFHAENVLESPENEFWG